MKRLFALILCALMLMTCATAMAAPDDVAFAPYAEPITMTIGRTTMPSTLDLPNGDDMENNKYLKYIEEKLGVKVTYDWLVDSSTYNQKVNLAITSGDLPDVMIVSSKSQLMQLVENDLIADLTGLPEQYFSDYVLDIYNSYADKGFGSCTFDGKVYAIPNLAAGYSYSYLWVRKDWVEACGAEMPTTMDDVVALAKLFMEKDPGHNGEGKTIGIAVNTKVAGVYNNLGNIDPLFHYFGAFPRQWVRGEDGKIVYGSVTEEMKTALSFVSGLYKDGIIDPEFVVRTSDDFNALLLSGRCGIFFGPWWMPDWPLNSSKTNNPECDWVPVLAPLCEDGTFNAYKQDESETWAVIRKDYAHPEAAFKVLNQIYVGMRGFDPSVHEFYPDLDIHWTVWPLPILLNYDDENVTAAHLIQDALDKHDPTGLDPQNTSFYEQSLLWLENKDESAWHTYMARVPASILAGSDNVRFVDNIYPARTDTMELKMAQLEKIEDETILKTIMGEKSIDEFDAFVNAWYSQGGQEITDEVNATYAK